MSHRERELLVSGYLNRISSITDPPTCVYVSKIIILYYEKFHHVKKSVPVKFNVNGNLKFCIHIEADTGESLHEMAEMANSKLIEISNNNPGIDTFELSTIRVRDKYISVQDGILNDYIINDSLKAGITFEIHPKCPWSAGNTLTDSMELLNWTTCPFITSISHSQATCTSSHYQHLLVYEHGQDTCEYGSICNMYQNTDEHNWTAICHNLLYKHDKCSRLAVIHDFKNIHQIYNVEKWYCSSFEDIKLKKLINESINNGYIDDFYIDDDTTTFGLVQVARNLLMDEKYYQYGLDLPEILSVVMYTGCDINYALGACQRQGAYDTWEIFDACLYSGLYKLFKMDNNKPKPTELYSGLESVKLKCNLKNVYLPTYMSTSELPRVAKDFADPTGMIVKMQAPFISRQIVVNVSKISKHGIEQEWLISRHLDRNNRFDIKIIDDSSSRYQTVQYC